LPDDLDRIARSEEICIAPDRPDGAPGRATTIWVVRIGDDLYVRSGGGPTGSWYSRAIATGHGTISTKSIERSVNFERKPEIASHLVDEAYRAKYAHDPSLPLLVSPAAQEAALRLLPA
jgi:hypothetical protein